MNIDQLLSDDQANQDYPLLRREALSNLQDVQNGPPLITLEKAWQEAMDQTKVALTAAEKMGFK